MPDVEVKINSMYPPGASGGIRAYASATVDGCLGIRGIKVVEGGRDGLFVSMPSSSQAAQPSLLGKARKLTRSAAPPLPTQSAIVREPF